MPCASNCARSRRDCVALAGLLALTACEPNVSVGAWTCSADGTASVIPSGADPIAIPWSTGFENRFCDYTELAGFCYPASTFEIVSSPTHDSSLHAAAFTVDSSSSDSNETQSRCVREGVLPTSAYYGAWYFVPALATNGGNWNVFHFEGGSDLTTLSGTMDVSLINANGGLELAVYGVGHVPIGGSASPPTVPIGAWFHIQLYVLRAAGTNGEVRLYQDGQQVFDAKNIATDNTAVGQWYVGNLASKLSPAVSTLYVDDVSISATL